VKFGTAVYRGYREYRPSLLQRAKLPPMRQRFAMTLCAVTFVLLVSV